MAGRILNPLPHDEDFSLICSCYSSNPMNGIHDPHCPLNPHCRLCGKSLDLCRRFNLSGCAGITRIGNMAGYMTGVLSWYLKIMLGIKEKCMLLDSLFLALYQTGRVPQSTFVNWNKKVAQLRAAHEKKAPTLDDVKNAEKHLLRLRRFYLDAKAESEKPIAPPQEAENDLGPLARNDD